MNNIQKNTVMFSNYTIGKDVLSSLSDVCKPYGDKILVIGGNTSIEIIKEKLAFLKNGTSSSCEDNNKKNTKLEVVGYYLYGTECTYDNMNKLTEIAVVKEANIIIGVGGGKAIDTAKGVAENLKLPVITIPTIAATCAATTALSVVYDEGGKFDSFYFMERPAVHCFIDTEIIAKAPVKYLRAGIGDTIAKHYECTLASRNDKLNHSSAMAREISKMCVEPVLEYGEKALLDAEKGQATFEVEQVVLNNIVSTGLVSMLIDEKYNGAIAHSLFYGLALLENIERDYLHGDVVGYGVLVQLAVDKNLDELIRLYTFFKKIGIPTSLKDIEVENDLSYLEKVLQETVDGPDMNHLPYEVTKEMIFEGIQVVEKI